MSKNKIYFLGALVVTIGAFSLLVTGSSILSIAFDNHQTIPLGTFITWAGVISLPLTLYWGIKELRKPTRKFNIVLAGVLKILIILGILWVPISYLLAGNIAFNFSEKESFQGGPNAWLWFQRLNLGIVLGTIATLFTYWISLLFKRK